jgi:hypothetical protein
MYEFLRSGAANATFSRFLHFSDARCAIFSKDGKDDERFLASAKTAHDRCQAEFPTSEEQGSL